MTDTPGTTYVADLEADNRRLRRLLDQRDAPRELRHRLQSTLAMLRVVIRRSAETKRDLDAYVAHLEDRLDAIARAQAAADETGTVGLLGLLSNELSHYGAKEGEQLSLSGPEIQLQPRAGQVLALAVHELAVNAIEHGAAAVGGRIAIDWELIPTDTDPMLVLTWKESGSILDSAERRSGFGSEVLTRTIAYELKATSQLDFEGDGLRYTVRFPFGKRTGQALSRG